jgi:hypothetical protein
VLENPAIIENVELIDIGNFIAIALYQEDGTLGNKYKEAIEYINNHYYRGRYYSDLLSKGMIPCSDEFCEDCS